MTTVLLAWLGWASGPEIRPLSELVGERVPKATVEARLAREPVWCDPRITDQDTLERVIGFAFRATWVKEGEKRTLLRTGEQQTGLEALARERRARRIAQGLTSLLDAFGRGPDGTVELDPGQLSRAWEQALRTSTTGRNPASILARLALASRTPGDLAGRGLEWSQEVEYGFPGAGRPPVWEAVVRLIASGTGRVEGADAAQRPTLTHLDPARLRGFVQLSGSPEILFATARITLDDGTLLDTGQALVQLPRARLEPDHSEGPDFAVWIPGRLVFLRDRAFPSFRGHWGRWASTAAPNPPAVPPVAEPLEWLRPLLAAEADASPLPIFVNLPDEVAPILAQVIREKGRLGPGTLDALVAAGVLDLEEIEGVAVYRPSDPVYAESTRLDRVALEKLVRGAVRSGTLSLSSLAEAMVSSPSTGAQGLALDGLAAGLWEAGVSVPVSVPDRDFAHLVVSLRPSGSPVSASTSSPDQRVAGLVRRLGWASGLSSPNSANQTVGAAILRSGGTLTATLIEEGSDVFVREGSETVGPLSLPQLAEFAAAHPDLDRGWRVRRGRASSLKLLIEGSGGFRSSRAYMSAPTWTTDPERTADWPKPLREEFDRLIAVAKDRIAGDAKHRDTSRP